MFNFHKYYDVGFSVCFKDGQAVVATVRTQEDGKLLPREKWVIQFRGFHVTPGELEALVKELPGSWQEAAGGYGAGGELRTGTR